MSVSLATLMTARHCVEHREEAIPCLVRGSGAPRSRLLPRHAATCRAACCQTANAAYPGHLPWDDVMSCCGESFADTRIVVVEPRAVGRRGILRAAAPALAAPFIAASARAASKTLQIGFCSQLLCAPPYVVAQAGGCFKAEGLDVEIVYLRGSPAVMGALVGGALDYGATAFDDVLVAANRGLAVTRFLSTAKLPLSALAVAPGKVQEIKTVADLEGHTVGVVSPGSPAEGWLRTIMKKAGADSSKVRFASLGPNILEPLRQNQVDAAWINEPSLTLIERAGGKALVNFMETDDANRLLGGRYEFMGVSVRKAEAASRHDEMVALGRALTKGLGLLQSLPAAEVVRSFPPPMRAGLDVPLTEDVIGRTRAALYPVNTVIDLAACDRVADTLKFIGLIKPEIAASQVLDLTIATA
jgi:NitT/TauT family transport system substrate-binding protein